MRDTATCQKGGDSHSPSSILYFLPCYRYGFLGVGEGVTRDVGGVFRVRGGGVARVRGGVARMTGLEAVGEGAGFCCWQAAAASRCDE